MSSCPEPSFMLRFPLNSSDVLKCSNVWLFRDLPNCSSDSFGSISSFRKHVKYVNVINRPGGYSDLSLLSNVYFVLAGPFKSDLISKKEFDEIPFSK